MRFHGHNLHEISELFSGENQEDNLHEMSVSILWENKKNILNLSSAEIAQSYNKI